jgi:hypothetical protein|tara:strand:- start:511 stop:615 length:105 start_codon:yes stop_codon:yes gene_type:complete
MSEPMITLGDLVEILATDLTQTEIEAFLYDWGIA